MDSRPHLRKFPLDQAGAPQAREGEIDIRAAARIGYSSEDPDHPLENMFDGSSGLGATYWASGRPDTAETITIEFDEPQSISRLVYEVVEAQRSRTQEIRVEASDDDGKTYRQLLVQEYSFSPHGATFQKEDLRFHLDRVTHLRLTIVPHKNGSGPATVSNLRLFR